MSGETALRERAQLLDELRQIVQSMKNLALAELQRVSRLKQAQALAQEAIAQGLSQLPQPEVHEAQPQTAKVTWLVIGAERGFCGAFNTQLLIAVQALLASQPDARLLVASHRLLTQLAGVSPSVTALPGCAASDEVELVLDAWGEAVHRAIGAGAAVWLMHVGSQGVVRQPVWPLPSADAAQPVATPQLYLPVGQVREALRRQALRLAIQGALAASLEQENHWRLAQMQRAQDHLAELGRSLRRRYATLRQANITNELENLASSTIGVGRT